MGGKTVREVFADERAAALVDAASRGDFARADAQIKAGADVNDVGDEGLTPLLWVMGTTRDVRKIEYLLKAGANPNYIVKPGGESAMYFAAGGDRPDILELLLRYKGDPNLTGPRGNLMLVSAVGQLRDKNVDLLLKYGADINLPDKHNKTVANYAAIFGRFDLLARFLDLGLNYDLQGVARSVAIRQVPADSEQQRWKDKVIEMLKVRGVIVSAFVPNRTGDYLSE
ncbi:ankyrin repeat domain-containing protein [Pseudomonas schmalbachii]|uniref:Ankyrin repeat domain-containing protein n=1 Tax=Pseudomonas schmalbachii TaxID=2816993 RepID=A0ABS3TV54_9PSED|nr:ankyrin repeat domain-containing protein [Pseudomonas schmalbachii]MBO3276555.1 ankyrin repeat domain-containing protein [Pseudomonas schmalbachii]